MRILLDNNLHVDLVSMIPGHEVRHCRDLGWQQLANGELVRQADQQFDLLLTLDKNMQFQTSLKGLQLAVLTLDARSNRIADLEPFVELMLPLLGAIKPATYQTLQRDGTIRIS